MYATKTFMLKDGAVVRPGAELTNVDKAERLHYLSNNMATDDKPKALKPATRKEPSPKENKPAGPAQTPAVPGPSNTGTAGPAETGMQADLAGDLGGATSGNADSGGSGE
jgi:hypothetical protein